MQCHDYHLTSCFMPCGVRRVSDGELLEVCLIESAVSCAAGLAAASGNEKVQANAIRALGYLLASYSCSSSRIAAGSAQRASAGGQPDRMPCSSPRCSSQQNVGQDSLAEHRPGWVEPGLQALCTALQSASVKVQWNACYAVGALLRCRHAGAAALRLGLLEEILQQLLHTLQHSSNFKAILCILPESFSHRTPRPYPNLGLTSLGMLRHCQRQRGSNAPNTPGQVNGAL